MFGIYYYYYFYYNPLRYTISAVAQCNGRNPSYQLLNATKYLKVNCTDSLQNIQMEEGVRIEDLASYYLQHNNAL